ncbi:hypothetical protein BU26DRAFT_516449 [Trematosphaeria pertusa]|uniref:Inositol-pentakisphosphate 2-kinase n=1 Tax=Trematosphaeria pertusa TaxID=390896 RepID=A0A6A6IM65_9PLEO|nr:uncharacterized protein BU26DRAFT_516449 [Trematosphaeria pertusa]KAF2251665.1 hypothetical protein BU26DRAFT_516449 [Trematosphaeria pertusa]
MQAQPQPFSRLAKMEEIPFTNNSIRSLPTGSLPILSLQNTKDSGTDMDTEPSFSTPAITCCLAAPDDPATALVRFTYLAEGAANVVFKICPGSQKAPDGLVFVDDDDGVLPREGFLGKVLRISKGNPRTPSSREIIAGFETFIRPLFKYKQLPPWRLANTSLNPDVQPERFDDYLIDHEGVILSGTAIKQLAREYDRHHSATTHDANFPVQLGILLHDMSSVPKSSVTIEIKPKWLFPSPNAIKHTYRCRNCALRKSRGAGVDGYICPLRWVRGNRGNNAVIKAFIREKVSTALSNTGEELPESEMLESIVNRATTYLTTGPGQDLMLHLRAQQVKLDPFGIGGEYMVEETEEARVSWRHNLRLAMTLRDCSLFIRIPYADASLPIEAKLGDLDVKSLDKLPDWFTKEEHLINGGWYKDREPPDYGCLMSALFKHWVPWHV